MSSMQLAKQHLSAHGEGVLWHPPTSTWWWTDIDSSVVLSWKAASDELVTYKFPDRVGAMVHCKSGRLLVGLAKRLCFADIANASGTATMKQPNIELAAPVDALEPRTRVNDGRTDRRGFFVFGTMNEAAEKRPIGSFYQYSLQHSLRRLALPAAAITNSICFSPDGNTMYFTDTLTRAIMQCDYDAESAQVGNIRLFANIDGDIAYPDGSIIDSEGCLWNAQWNAYRVVRYSPQGDVLKIVDVPAKNPSCPAIGGDDLKQLVAITSRQDMSCEDFAKMPDAGSLYAFQLDKALGISDTLFDDDAA